MRMRLERAGLWPPERPDVPKRTRNWYFRHTQHAKAGEVSSCGHPVGSCTVGCACGHAQHPTSHVLDAQIPCL